MKTHTGKISIMEILIIITIAMILVGMYLNKKGSIDTVSVGAQGHPVKCIDGVKYFHSDFGTAYMSPKFNKNGSIETCGEH